MNRERFDRCVSIMGSGLLVFALGALTACGVQEAGHDSMAKVDVNKDLGGSNGSVAGAGAAMNAAGSGGSMVAPGGQMSGMSTMMTGAGGAPPAKVTPDSGTSMGPATPPGSDAGMQPMMNPSPSGVTIDIGGATVAKEDAIAFIHIGHSNMAGRATGPMATRPYFFNETDPHAWMYHTGMPPQPAQEPYTAEDDLSGFYGGPGTALVKQAAALAPSKYFISLGYGKTSAYCSQFLPGSLYYDTMMTNTLAIKDRVTFAAIVIMLGITERHGTADDINGFAQCINKLVTAIRKDVGRPDLPMLISDYEQEASGTLAVGTPFATQITPQIRMIPDVVSNSSLVPTDKLTMQDDHHFDFDGHKEWTRRVLQIMQDKGWFPWK